MITETPDGTTQHSRSQAESHTRQQIATELRRSSATQYVQRHKLDWTAIKRVCTNASHFRGRLLRGLLRYPERGAVRGVDFQEDAYTEIGR